MKPSVTASLVKAGTRSNNACDCTRRRKRVSKSETVDLGFDPDALREKYRVERDKRLRADGADQYIALTGRFAHYNDDDPYVAPGYTRAPINDDKDVIVIGG